MTRTLFRHGSLGRVEVRCSCALDFLRFGHRIDQGLLFTRLVDAMLWLYVMQRRRRAAGIQYH